MSNTQSLTPFRLDELERKIESGQDSFVVGREAAKAVLAMARSRVDLRQRLQSAEDVIRDVQLSMGDSDGASVDELIAENIVPGDHILERVAFLYGAWIGHRTEQDLLRAACAEKDEALEDARLLIREGQNISDRFSRDSYPVLGAINAALKTGAGKGWMSPEDVERMKQEFAEMTTQGDRLYNDAVSALAKEGYSAGQPLADSILEFVGSLRVACAAKDEAIRGMLSAVKQFSSVPDERLDEIEATGLPQAKAMAKAVRLAKVALAPDAGKELLERLSLLETRLAARDSDEARMVEDLRAENARLRERLTTIEDLCPGGEIGDPDADALLARIYDLASGAVEIPAAAEPAAGTMTLRVGTCARCGRDHQAVVFRKLDHPVDDLTHWSPCPTNGQPIMLSIVTTEPEPGQEEEP